MDPNVRAQAMELLWVVLAKRMAGMLAQSSDTFGRSIAEELDQERLDQARLYSDERRAALKYAAQISRRLGVSDIIVD